MRLRGSLFISLVLTCALAAVRRTTDAAFADLTSTICRYHHQQPVRSVLFRREEIRSTSTGCSAVASPAASGSQVVVDAAHQQRVVVSHEDVDVDVDEDEDEDEDEDNDSSLSTIPTIGNNPRTIDILSTELVNGTDVGDWGPSEFQLAQTLVERLTQNRSTTWAALAVERLIRRIVEEQMAGNSKAAVISGVDMAALYMNLIAIWARSGSGAERAEEILDYFQQFYENAEYDGPLIAYGPSVDCFNAVIRAYAESSREDAPQQAIRVLGKLSNLHSQKRTKATPNKESYANVLQAWAKKATANSPEHVRQLLLNMENLACTYPAVKPDTNCQNVYLCALTEAMSAGTVPGKEGAMLAEEHLDRMLNCNDAAVAPNYRTFNTVITAWSRSDAPDRAERAEALVAKFEAYHQACGRTKQTEPSISTYNSLISCYVRCDEPTQAMKVGVVLERLRKLGETNPSLKPDTIMYNLAMKALIQAGKRNAPQEVEKQFREMLDLYEKTEDARVRPNLRSFNTCLLAWARSDQNGADDRILSWLDEMRKRKGHGEYTVTPNTWSYNEYLVALSKSRKPQLCERAEEVLLDMENSFKQGDHSVKPNVQTFTNVINCIARSGKDDAVERALALLNRMEDLHAQGYGDLRPDSYTYSCVINTIAKSKRRGKAELALKVLRRLQSVALRPQIATYNNVINSCAFSDHQEDDGEAILKIALNTLKEAQQGPGANWITYQTTIRVISSLVEDPDTRWELTREVFAQCCKDGQVTKSVMTQVRFAVSNAEFAELKKSVTENLAKFSRNTKKRKPSRRRMAPMVVADR